MAEIAQAEKIMSAAFLVVRRARYVNGRVTEKKRSKLMTSRFMTEALEER
jgi:hypothetical protein